MWLVGWLVYRSSYRHRRDLTYFSTRTICRQHDIKPTFRWHNQSGPRSIWRHYRPPSRGDCPFVALRSEPLTWRYSGSGTGYRPPWVKYVNLKFPRTTVPCVHFERYSGIWTRRCGRGTVWTTNLYPKWLSIGLGENIQNCSKPNSYLTAIKQSYSISNSFGIAF